MAVSFMRWLAAISMLLLTAGSPAADGERADTARDLDAIHGRIRNLESEIARAASARPTASQALKQAELVEADSRTALQGIRRQLADGRAREIELRSQADRANAELAAHRTALAWQLRLAYATGREEWLRLALTQQDPVALSRRLVYHGYITRQRGTLLQQVQTELQTLQATAAALHEQMTALAELESRRAARLLELSSARQVRARAVQTLERDLGSRQQKVAKLRREARSLSDLMERLERESRMPAARAEPLPESAPAQQLRDLPLRGRTIARFGQPRAGGLLRWEGLVLAAPAGAEVRAVRSGRVVYADWLPGMGSLLVVDHGRGYMSLYGHNQDLFKRVGDSVRQGEVISRVGDSGGQSSSGLYFEVRHNGKPINPREWVR
jgi:septal ring factor EnvC (AmiA/AmiB activator)